MPNENLDNSLNLTFHYRATFREFLGASFLLNYKSWIILIATLFLWSIGVFFLYVMVDLDKYYSLDDILFLITLFGFIPFMVFIATVWQFRLIKKEPIEYVITEKALWTKQGTISSEIGWDNIIKIEKIDKVLAFYAGKTQAYILPLRVVNDEQLQAILTLFQKIKS